MKKVVLILLCLISIVSTEGQTVSYQQAESYFKKRNYTEAIRIMKMLAEQEKNTEYYIDDIASIARYYSHTEEVDSVIHYCEQTQQLAEEYIGKNDSIAEEYIQSTYWNYDQCNQYEKSIHAAEEVLGLRDKIYGVYSQQAFEWLDVMSYQAFEKKDLLRMNTYCHTEIERAEECDGVNSLRFEKAISSIRGYAHGLIDQVPDFVITWIEPYYKRLKEENILPMYQYEFEILLLAGHLTLNDLQKATKYTHLLERWTYTDPDNIVPLEDKVRIELKLAIYYHRMGDDIAARYRIEEGWKMLEEAGVDPTMAQLIDRHIVERELRMDAQGQYCMNTEWLIKSATSVIDLGNENQETIAFFYESRSWAYQYLESYDKAIVDMKTSIALKPLDSKKKKLAQIYLAKGEYELAEKLYLDLYHDSDISASIKKSIEADLVALYWLMGNKDKLSFWGKSDFINSILDVRTAFAFMTENEREHFIDDSPIGSTINFDVYTSFSIGTEQWPEGNCMAYNLALVQKGLLLSTTKDIEYIISNAPDSIKEKAKLYDQFRSLYGEVDIEPTLTLWRELMQYVADQPEFLMQLNTTWQDVQRRLNNGEAAIEFINLHGIIPTDLDTFHPSIGALVLTKDSAPTFVYLTKVAELDSLYEYDDNGVRCDDLIYKGITKVELYNKIWRPLIPYLNNATTIFYAPTSALHSINLDFIGQNECDMLSDRYHLYRLSSTRELCNENQHNPSKMAVLYGDIAYSVKTHKIAEEPISKLRSTTRAGFCPLKGTAAEIDTIRSELTYYDYSNRSFSDTTATEMSFRRLSGHIPQMLHIATHGFYYTEEAAKEEIGTGNFIAFQLPKPELYRSGLALTGAQDSWKVENFQQYLDSDQRNDGILLSAEIAQMDLDGLDLVVLSACETALGKVTSEGIYGLQRAFKLAGAKSIIMSLWKVDDDATQKLMTYFYQNFLCGMSKREALLMAQKVLRKTSGFEDPYNWAAFILLDAIN